MFQSPKYRGNFLGEIFPFCMYFDKYMKGVKMGENWVLKVNTRKKIPYGLYKLLNNEDTRYKDNYCFNTYKNKPARIIKKLQKFGIKYECYPMKYERSNNYRQTFFSETTGPYRCRYCNKKLQSNKVFIDHIVPVAKAQKKTSARLMLSMKKCDTVNDIKNLAPACEKCNKKKSDKMGLWIVRGWLGKYKLYWILLRIIQISCIALMILFCLYIAKLIPVSNM